MGRSTFVVSLFALPKHSTQPWCGYGVENVRRLYVGWLSAVTYLHHHGQDEQHAQMPWFRGEEWSYLRGGLTTLDRDFGGLVNKLHHNIETHVLHHLFPQMPHYNLVEVR